MAISHGSMISWWWYDGISKLWTYSL